MFSKTHVAMDLLRVLSFDRKLNYFMAVPRLFCHAHSLRISKRCIKFTLKNSLLQFKKPFQKCFSEAPLNYHSSISSINKLKYYAPLPMVWSKGKIIHFLIENMKKVT